MPRGYTTRKLEAFNISAYLETDRLHTPNYISIFQTISNIPREDRIAVIGPKTIAIPRFDMAENLVRFIAYEGEEGNPLVFNFEAGTERIQHLGQGEKLATKTHGVIDAAQRVGIIEYNQKGAKAADIASAMEHFARTHGDMANLHLDFSQVIDEQFVLSIDRFSRIRTATVKLARPNPGWGDHRAHFDAMARESEAHYLELGASAERNESLARNRGIVGFIKDMASAALSTLKSAKVTGVREGEEAETSISTVHHVEHQRVQVRMTEDGHVDDADVGRKLDSFLRSKTERDG